MSQLADIEERLRLLRLASRSAEPLTDSRGVTPQGHILSAITKLERQRDELRHG